MIWLVFQWYQDKEMIELFIADVMASGRKLLEGSYELLAQF